MKCTVEYYDIDTDSAQTKKCESYSYNAKDSTFEFVPVDVPITIYKAKIIQHPLIWMWYEDRRGMKLSIEGWQCVKRGGYSKTTTIIRIENE